MSFQARYDGRCGSEDCRYDGVIDVGDEVEFEADELMHQGCAQAVRRGRTVPLCSECFTHHRGEC